MKNIWIIFVFINVYSFSQSNTSSFFKLSTPEKYWVIFHPFKANRAFNISNDAIKTTDSIYNVDVLDNDKNGGQTDAFKHSYWIASLTQEIGEKAALKLGVAHEKGNFRAFKKGKLEDGNNPDQPSSEMDLYNNEIGSKIALKNPDLSKMLLIETLITKIKAGKMKVLKKDDSGNFLTCEGSVIHADFLVGKWENDKCLIPSNL